MDVRSALSGHDDRAVVSEAERGDSITVLAFKSAVEGALPATVRDLVERGYDEVAASHLRFADLNGVSAMSTITTVAEPIAPRGTTADTMMALVYGGAGKRAWQSMPRPVVREPGDAVVRITTSTICGTDLHIMKGDVPTVTPGRILGHEGIGIIDSVGARCRRLRSATRC